MLIQCVRSISKGLRPPKSRGNIADTAPHKKGGSDSLLSFNANTYNLVLGIDKMRPFDILESTALIRFSSLRREVGIDLNKFHLYNLEFSSCKLGLSAVLNLLSDSNVLKALQIIKTQK
jgi:hypothetical protein